MEVSGNENISSQSILDSRLSRNNGLPQPLHPLHQPLLARSKTPPYKPLPLRPERNPRRQPEFRPDHQLLAERQAVLHAFDAEKRVHRTGRRRSHGAAAAQATLKGLAAVDVAVEPPALNETLGALRNTLVAQEKK